MFLMDNLQGHASSPARYSDVIISSMAAPITPVWRPIPSQRASGAENVSISLCYHGLWKRLFGNMHELLCRCTNSEIKPTSCWFLKNSNQWLDPALYKHTDDTNLSYSHTIPIRVLIAFTAAIPRFSHHTGNILATHKVMHIRQMILSVVAMHICAKQQTAFAVHLLRNVVIMPGKFGD